jgi:MFS family permease
MVMREIRRIWGLLPPTVIALGVVSLLTDLSSEMIYPLLPVFLVEVLGAGALALGVIEGVAESTAALLKVASGWATDRSGRRKPLVVAGYSVSGLARPLIGAAAAWPVVVGLRFIDRIGKGLRTSPRDALIADVVAPGMRGTASGFHRAMDHLGAVLGPLVAAALLAIPAVTLRGVFYLAAVPSVAVLVVLVTAVREPAGSIDPQVARPRLGDVLRESSGDFRLLLVAVFVFALGNSSDAFLLLRFTEAGLATGWLAVLWSAHHVVKLGFAAAGGRLADRFGPKPLLLIGWGLYVAVYLIFALIPTLPVLIATFMAYGVVFGLTEPSERAWVAEAAPSHARGAAFGLLHGTLGMAALPASVVFGAIYTGLGPSSAFAMGATLAALASGLLLIARRPSPLPSTL